MAWGSEPAELAELVAPGGTVGARCAARELACCVGAGAGWGMGKRTRQKNGPSRTPAPQNANPVEHSVWGKNTRLWYGKELSRRKRDLRVSE